MGRSMTIKNVRRIEDGLWEAMLQDTDLRSLEAPVDSYGDQNILIVNDRALKFRAHSRRITFDSTRARLVNRGESNRTIIVRGCRTRRTTAVIRREVCAPDRFDSGGDRHFIRSLAEVSPLVQHLGEQLLLNVRDEFDGGLKFYPKSTNYAETPDNFWSVRVQPSDQSLRIIVRGEPRHFGPVTGVELKPDRPGYSSFKIWKPSQLASAVAIIKAAQRN